MTYDEFNAKLEANNMSLKDFGELCGQAYSTVTKYKYLKSIPGWVDSWFEMYEKTNEAETIKSKIIAFAEDLKQNDKADN